MIDSEGSVLDRIIHAWPIVTFAMAMFLAAWRFLVVAPFGRIAALERKLDDVTDGVNELRVAQARASDQHAESIKALTQRIDRALEASACNQRHRECDH